jgi:RHS repeat-associated protein
MKHSTLLILLYSGALCSALTSLARSPFLFIEYGTNSQIRLCWTNAVGTIVLEQTDSLSPVSAWRRLAQVPATSNGQFSVTIDSTSGGRFFRFYDFQPDGLPPDPIYVAPAVPQSVPTLLADATEFLYTGTNAIQSGVAPGTIEARRVAVVRGKVRKRDNSPLSGVTISILNHPEFGRTLSRGDGMFDLAVNGGGPLTVKYEKADFCPAQRQANAPWQDWVTVEDVVMIQMDPLVTSVALGSNSPTQIHQGSLQTDADGARKATVFIPQGATAEMVMPDGSTHPMPTLSLRATEFTVGANGPQAMPADLPPTSGYTYCVELSADEAMAAGATDVRFNVPLPFYVENFLGFPVGTTVPLGSYDRARGAWIPADSGKVIKLLGIDAGLASLDIDGDGVADSGAALAQLSITEAERERLAGLYTPGQSLWRVLIPHFTPWDANWSLRPPDDAVAPDKDPRLWRPTDHACSQSGNSVIEIQNQILGEAFGVIGTPFSLHYQSERVPGRKEAYSVDIPLSGAQLPASLRRIELEVSIAGQFSRQSFPPALNQTTTFVWNGQNVYGQPLQGMQPITIRIGYTYRFVYGQTTRFGYNGGDSITASPSREEVTLWRTFRGKIGSWDARGNAPGGWSLSVHHTYDPEEQILYRGDGGRQSARTIGSTISTYVGTGQFLGGPLGDGGPATEALIAPWGLAVGPDGSLYIASPAQLRVRRVTPDGIIRTVAGNNFNCPGCGDGGQATNAGLGSPLSVAVGSDGNLYIGEGHANRPVVRKVSPNGIISTFAGTGVNGYSGDGGPATLAQISTAFSLAVGPDNSVYLADTVNRRVRRITTDGIINTVAGTGAAGFSGDGGPATLAMLADPRGIAVGRDGSLYIADAAGQRVRQVTPDGIIHTIAGTGGIGFDGEGVPAATARFKFPTAIAVGPDDSLYILDQGNFRVRWMRLGGTINTLAGNGFPGSTGDGGPGRQASLQGLHTGLAIDPDGAVYVSQTETDLRVRRISPPTESFLAGAAGEILVPDRGGGEVYVFNISGRHLRTLDALTGALRYQFTYDAGGRLTTVTDGDNNATTIEHDGNGHPTAIVGPFGQRTILELNADGFLERLVSPAGEAMTLTYTPEGLLTSVTHPGGQTSTYAYDAIGRLIRATDPAGNAKTLNRSGANNDFTVAITSALGRTTTHRVETQDNGDMRQTNTGCDGDSSQSMIGADGRQTTTYADGSSLGLVLGPDPLWGMRSPIAASLSVSNSGGLTQTITTRRTAVRTAPRELFNPHALTNVFTVNGRAWTNTYNGTNRTIVSTSPSGRRGRITLDARGWPAQAQFGDLDPIDYTYDARGRLATAALGQGPGARLGVFTNGPDGFLASITDPLGRTTFFTNDANGRVTAQTLPGGRVFQFDYDPNGRLRGVTPPGRPEHSFTLDARGNVTAYTPPPAGVDTAETRYAYDADRNRTRIDLPGGGNVGFHYEGGTCRLTGVDLGTRQRTYSYDTVGRLSSLGSSQGISLAYAYQGAILSGATWSGVFTGSVTRTYDSDFRVTAIQVNGSDPVAISYDADNLPVQVGALVMTRTGDRRFITGTTLGATSDSLTYSGFREPATFTAIHQGTILCAFTNISFDALGRILEQTEAIGGATRTLAFDYDPAGRLREARRDGIAVASYDYDANGNRVSRTDASGTIAATYDAQDRLLQYGSTSYTHNPKGERTRKVTGGQTTSYRYDGLGNLTGVTLPDGTQIEYLLDALDRRGGKRVNGALVQAFLYQDRLRPIAELDGDGGVVSRFVYATGGSVPDYMVRGGVTCRIVTDHLGSPRLVFDVATGQILQQMDHDEFGRVLLDSNPGFQPFGFAGGLYDQQTGLVHFGAREYDPETGRWTVKDPLGFGGGDANLYAYVANDPVNATDPLGLAGGEIVEVIFAGEIVEVLGEIVEVGSPAYWRILQGPYRQSQLVRQNIISLKEYLERFSRGGNYLKTVVERPRPLPASQFSRLSGALGSFVGAGITVLTMTDCDTVNGLVAIARQKNGGLLNVYEDRMLRKLLYDPGSL